MTVVQDADWRTCFVIMPYGKRQVNDASVDFDKIYATIFKPAIQNVRVKGTTRLLAYRSDEAAQSRLLIHSLVQRLAKSRLALADLTGHNPNVLYELGVRHHLIGSGTVVVRMSGVQIPFDLTPIAVTDYRHHPTKEAIASIARISKALRETLRHNDVDNPVFAAARQFVRKMGSPERPSKFGEAVVTAEEAALHGDTLHASDMYMRAVALEPDIPLLHQRRASLLLQSGRVAEATKAFRQALVLHLPKEKRTGVLDGLLEIPIQGHLVQTIRKRGELELGKKLDLSELIEGSATKDRDEVHVKIGPLEGSRRLGVEVVCSPTLHGTGTVYDVLAHCGRVTDKGMMVFPQLGRTVSRYEVMTSAARTGSLTMEQIADGLKQLTKYGAKLRIKRGGFAGGGGLGGTGGGSGPLF